jgi:hypothetical protein
VFKLQLVKSDDNSWDTSVSITTDYGLADHMIGVQMLVGDGNFSL